jgi:hypothetical protein
MNTMESCYSCIFFKRCDIWHVLQKERLGERFRERLAQVCDCFEKKESKP